MAVLCPQCRLPAADDARRCPGCGAGLFDRPVMYVDDAVGDPGRVSAGWSSWPATPFLRPYADADRLSDGGDGPLAGATTLVRTWSGPLWAGGSGVDGGGGPLGRVVGGTAAHQLVVTFSRRVRVSPRAAADVAGAWRRRPPPILIDRYRVRIVDGADHPHDGCVLHLMVVIAGLVRWPGRRMQLEVVPWSRSNTELRLCPVGVVHPTSGYFRAGHAFMDRLVADVDG